MEYLPFLPTPKAFVGRILQFSREATFVILKTKCVFFFLLPHYLDFGSTDYSSAEIREFFSEGGGPVRGWKDTEDKR
jgi:hypothetical protein